MSRTPFSNRPRPAISWLGLAAVAGGLTLVRLYFSHPRLAQNPNLVIAIVYLGTGGILIMWGLRALLGEIAFIFGRWRYRQSQRYRVRMPPEAFMYMLILVVLCLGALLGHSNMLMLVFGLTAGPFVLNGQMTLGILQGLRVTRRLPEHATVDENFSVTLGLSNRKRFLSSWMVVVEDIVQSPDEQLQPAVLFACVPANSKREAAYEIRPARRGKYEFGPVRVMSRFPLGLMERSFELGQVEQLIVYPRIGRLTPRWRRSSDAGEPVSDLARGQAGANDDEFHRLREYRPGDNPRAIHWRTTARRSQLMVREYQHNRRQELLLVVDLWLPARAKNDDLERVELAVSLAASICVDQMQAAVDSSVDLVICGRETSRLAGPAGSRSISGLLEELAVAQAGPAAGLSAVLRETTRPHLRRVLLTCRPSDLLQSAIAAGARPQESGALGDFEVIAADLPNVMDYLEFDDRPVAAPVHLPAVSLPSVQVPSVQVHEGPA